MKLLIYNKPLYVTSIVDGSEQRVGAALNTETKINNYSAKKAYPSITKLVFCSSIGKIQYLSKSRPDSRNDQSMMYEVLDKFDKTYEYIMGDKGDEKEADNRLKSIRIIIENVFAQIKKFSITTHTFRFKNKKKSTHILDIHHKIWSIIAFLVNSYVEENYK
ncbi:hypothetical protein RB653_004402 [Dictyostelium firmibasis]|uniref:DDE Tnp4 domain-containing protein n=1 Tax=Dictyostelium firmibasis TaxID=79012 RepID=A0AAN7Z3B4_9MYCE